MTESQIKTKIMAWLKTVPQCKAIRVEQRPGMGRGVSDILICYRGTFLAVEVKLPGNKPTYLQQSFMIDVEQAGGYSILITTNEAKIAIETLKKEFWIND